MFFYRKLLGEIQSDICGVSGMLDHGHICMDRWMDARSFLHER